MDNESDVFNDLKQYAVEEQWTMLLVFGAVYSCATVCSTNPFFQCIHTAVTGLVTPCVHLRRG